MRRAVALLLVLAAACSQGQDPGVPPPASGGSSTTSHVLSPCPDGGPDATTPAAGCLDPDGNVIRP